jgi:uncharacterized protein
LPAPRRLAAPPRRIYVQGYIPEEIGEADDRIAAIAETVAQMDAHNIRVGVFHKSDDRADEALRRYPDRFAAIRPVDPNKGMDAVRLIQREFDEGKIKGVPFFPSGQQPPVWINSKLAYPIYAKCIELDLPIFINVGVPGPRIPMMPQWVGHLDEVCYDLPELKVVMRHGAEPDEALGQATAQMAESVLFDQRLRPDTGRKRSSNSPTRVAAIR